DHGLGRRVALGRHRRLAGLAGAPAGDTSISIPGRTGGRRAPARRQASRRARARAGARRRRVGAPAARGALRAVPGAGGAGAALRRRRAGAAVRALHALDLPVSARPAGLRLRLFATLTGAVLLVGALL